MPSTIGNYKLGKTLGEGVTAKVKLGTSPDGQQVAIKIFDITKPNIANQIDKLMAHEFEAVRMLD